MNGHRYFHSSPGRANAPLLVALCRRYLGTADEDLVRDSLNRSFEPRAFLALVRSHGLLLIANHVLAPYRAYFPTEFWSEWDAAVKRLVLNHVRLAKIAVDIHRAFASASITHVFLKGPVLAEALFPGQVLRTCTDIDVLVAPRDLSRADVHLRELGYAPVSAQGSSGSALGKKDVIYRRADRPHPIELHTRTHDLELLFERGESLESVIRPQAFHGEAMPVLADVPNAIYLALHGAKHHWSSFRWLMDLAVLFPQKELSWATTMVRAQELHLEKPLREAAFLLYELFGIENVALPKLSTREIVQLGRGFDWARDSNRSRWARFCLACYRSLLVSGFWRRCRMWFFLTRSLPRSSVLRRLPRH
jgi:hypothetical protein